MTPNLCKAISRAEEQRKEAWERQVPCDTNCPLWNSKDCRGPCDLYHEWLNEEPSEVAKREKRKRRDSLERRVKIEGGHIVWD